MPTLYVKKIWTLNPTGYKYISLDKAVKQYHGYARSFGSSIERYGIRGMKTFQEWLSSEI